MVVFPRGLARTVAGRILLVSHGPMNPIMKGNSMLKVVTAVARTFRALKECEKTGNDTWAGKHSERIRELINIYFPHGSGFDAGSGFDFEKSSANKLVFYTSFHHMTDGGMYDGWTDHTIIATPDLAFGFSLRVTGRNKRDIKEYIGECFQTALDSDAEQSPTGGKG